MGVRSNDGPAIKDHLGGRWKDKIEEAAAAADDDEEEHL